MLTVLAGAGLGWLVAVYGFTVGALLLVLLIVTGYLVLTFTTPERGLWLLAIALPYERLGAFPLGFFTLKLTHIIGAMMLVAWATRSLLTKTFRLVYDPLRIPLLLLIAAGILSLINAVNLTRGVALLAQLGVALVIYTLVLNFLSRRNLKPVLIALWAGSLVVGLFGLYQFVGDFLKLPTTLTGLLPQYSGANVFGFARIQGPALEPLYFANYLLVPLLTATAFLLGIRGKRRVVLVPFLLLLLIVFVLTLARGAYLGLAAGLLGLAWIFRRELFSPKVLAVAAASLFTVGAIVTVLLLGATSRGGDPLQAFTTQIQVTGSDVSGQQRSGSVSAAAGLVAEHPLIGLGIGNFGEYYQDPLSGSSSTSQVVNNQTLETLVETGVLGLFSLLLLTFVLARRTLEAFRAVGSAGRNRLLRVALAGTAMAVLAIFIQAQTFSALYQIHIWFAIGLLVGIQNLILLPKRAQPKDRSEKEQP